MIRMSQQKTTSHKNNLHRFQFVKMSSSNSLLFVFAIILIINQSNGNDLNDIDQINSIMSLGIPPSTTLQQQKQQQQHQQEQQQQQHGVNGEQQHHREISPQKMIAGIGDDGFHLNEKRSWQSLQGSWGKRATNDFQQDDYDSSNYYTTPNDVDEETEYDDGNTNNYGNTPYSNKYAYLLHHNGRMLLPDQLLYPNEQKRAWKSMSGAWGKRLSNGDNWNRFRGSWGKREPGWNNLKGLWGKRATNWSKLQNAWGKRGGMETLSSY